MEVEKFFGCYLLYSLNEKFKGRTYIGFTVDPNRRIKQHNRGLKAGGAWKTNNKGPWDMILIVHGFPTDVAALRFEWAWQNPLKSRRLRHVGKKIPRESALKYRFRVMSEMLRVGPWNRLPLTVQWLNISYKQDFDVSKLPPLHIPICVGPIVPQKVKNIKEDTEVLNFCFLCHQIVTKEKRFICFNKDCKEAFHVICLGKTFIFSQHEKEKFLLPVDGNCPNCNAATLWGDVIRYVSGCYQEPQDVATNASPKIDSNTISVEKSKTKNEFHKVPESETDSKEPQVKFETKTDYESLLALNDVHLIENVEQFECPVCFVDFDVGEGVTLQECLHSFCRVCLASTIQFSETVVVKCPFRNEEYTCESYLQEREVKALVTPEVYEKHLQRSVTLAESQAQNSFHCKTPDCPGWCLFEASVIVFLCPVCKHTNCITCAAIHEGKNCRQYQDDVAFYSDSREEARKTREHLQNMLDNGEAMRCPHCQIILIKNGGCDSLWCSMCRTHIRWTGKGSFQERMNALDRTSSSLFGFISSLTQSTDELFRGSTSAFGVPRLTFGGFGNTNAGKGSRRSRRTRTGLFGSTVPTADIDLPLLSAGRVGSNISPYAKYTSSRNLPSNIIPSTSVGSSGGIGLRVGLPTRDPIRLRSRGNTSRKKKPAMPHWLQDSSSPLDINFNSELSWLQDISSPWDSNSSPEFSVPTTDINLPLLSSGNVGSNISPYAKYTSSWDLSRNIIPSSSVGSNEGIGLNRKKRATVIQRFQVPTTDIDLPHLSSGSVGTKISPYAKYTSSYDLPRSIIPSTSVGSNEGIGLRVGITSKDPIDPKGRDNTNRKKRATLTQRLQDISAAIDLNLTPGLLSGPSFDENRPFYVPNVDFLENSASQKRKSKQEKRLTKEETAVINSIDKRATVKRRKKLEEKRLLEKETAVRKWLNSPSPAYDHFLEKSDSIKRKSIQERHLTKEETAVTNKIEKRATVKRRKKLDERRLMEESETKFDENHPYFVPNIASFNLLEKSATAYGKRTNRLGEIHLIKEETAVKSKTRFDENNPYYVPNVASFNLLERSATAYGKSTNGLGETHLIKEETAVKSEPSFDERHHDVPKFSDINSLEKSATIHGKGIKNLIKIETIVKSKIFK